jgi:hypothetical protein
VTIDPMFGTYFVLDVCRAVQSGGHAFRPRLDEQLRLLLIAARLVPGEARALAKDWRPPALAASSLAVKF